MPMWSARRRYRQADAVRLPRWRAKWSRWGAAAIALDPSPQADACRLRSDRRAQRRRLWQRKTHAGPYSRCLRAHRAGHHVIYEMLVLLCRQLGLAQQLTPEGSIRGERTERA